MDARVPRWLLQADRLRLYSPRELRVDVGQIFAPLKTPISLLQKKRAFATITGIPSSLRDLSKIGYGMLSTTSPTSQRHTLVFSISLSHTQQAAGLALLEEIQGKDNFQHQKLGCSKLSFPQRIKLFQRRISTPHQWRVCTPAGMGSVFVGSKNQTGSFSLLH